MPTIELLPNANVSNDWTEVGSGAVFEKLRDNDLTNYLKHSTVGRTVEVEFDALNLPTGAVIASVKGVLSGDFTLRSQTGKLTCSYRDSSSNLINSYSEEVTMNTAGFAILYDMTVRETSDGSAAWTVSDVDGMRLRCVIHTAPASGEIILTQLKIVVTYVTATYTSDDNLILKNGTTVLKNGKIEV
jgi:hypothetical protein